MVETRHIRFLSLLGFAAFGAAVPAAAQYLPAASFGAAERAGSCPGDLGSRLREAHPLGATAVAAPSCLAADEVRWVPTRAMSPEERARWSESVDRLARAPDVSCRQAASVLSGLERTGRISIWRAVDTAGGIVYFGATYVAPDSTPLAVQFWAPAFDRPLEWLVGAAAHEGFHVLHPEAAEAAAIAFGEGCRQRSRVPAVIADAG